MLRSIKLQFTETGELNLPAKGITIFVGPNNAGKSLSLQEVERIFESSSLPENLKILTDFEIEWPSIENIKSAIKKVKTSENQNAIDGSIVLTRFKSGGTREVARLHEEVILNIAKEQTQKNWFANNYLKWGVIRLDGRSRFALTTDQNMGDLTQPPQNILAYFFQDDEAREKIRALTKDAFGLYFVIDPTEGGKLKIRLSATAPTTNEQSLDRDARKFHKEATYIKEASDGVQAFVGIVTAVRSGEFHTILIDEPEAFLHPPLARKLGKDLASLAAEKGGSLMAATHSADFLMGCVQASSAVQVVRLDYSEGKSRARMIQPEALKSLFSRPLMRSANVVSGLFHDGVVVLESDNDRAFYSEIYYRIAEEKAGYPSILFVNAQNKQTIREIIGPMRQFGVPAAAIPDIDFLKDGGKTWTDWLTAARVPDALHQGYGQQRSAINSAFLKTDKNMKTDGGLSVLPEGDRLAAEQLFSNLEEFGIFPVRRGELEDWLKELNVPGKKTDWTVAMLERLGSDPSDPAYVKPSVGDVWDFIEKVVAWIRNPSRKGM